MSPVRIQRSRAKGWRMPEGAVYVGRPSIWGNPYRAVDYLDWYTVAEIPALTVADFRHGCIERTFIEEMPEYPSVGSIKTELAGHDLVCWCPVCDAHRYGLPLGVTCPDCRPCHADVLLVVANAA